MDQIGFGVLGNLHSINVYHNDLKPANIMFDTRKQLFYLIDFGLAVPLSLLNQSVFESANFFTTLSFMSPWHLKLVSRHYRYIAGDIYKYKMSNNNATRTFAAKADFYSLGLTALRILGMHCSGNDSMCAMAKEIVALQNYPFGMAEEASFVHWKVEKIEQMLTPYWTKIQEILEEYARVNPHQETLFLSTLMDWVGYDWLSACPSQNETCSTINLPF